MAYWRNEGLPDDDAKLARIVRLSAPEWSEIRSTVADLFQPGWRHGRIDAEIEKSKSRSTVAREKANRRWGSNAAAGPVQSKPDAAAMPRHVPQHSPGNAGLVLGQCKSQSQSSIGADAPIERGPAPRAARRTGRRVQPDQQPTDRDLEAADRAGLTREQTRSEWAGWRDHHSAKGTIIHDFEASWREWLRRTKQFNRGGTTHDDDSKSVAAAARRLNERLSTMVIPPRPRLVGLP